MKKLYLLLITLCALAPTVSAQALYHPEELHVLPPHVPEYVVFAGDTVRFDRTDFYERMDRELISFTYSHTNSLLMLKKSDRFFSIVRPILKAQGVPDDIKYLMAIESNLVPSAVSGAGAAGLWQFTKSTAQKYGLEVSDEVDERYNIEKETVAACAYLLEAYGKYGDWMTAAASYNAGQNGISKRLADQHQDSALELWLYEETSRYMFRLMAAKMFFTKPEAFGFHVERSDKYPVNSPKKTLTISTGIPDLVAFAEENGVSYAHLKEANLWLRDTKLTNKAGKTYKILIP